MKTHPNEVKFMRFDPKNPAHKAAGACCVCNRDKLVDGVVAETEGFHLAYCTSCVAGMRAGAASARPPKPVSKVPARRTGNIRRSKPERRYHKKRDGVERRGTGGQE
jgi:hypothetical protein